MERPLYLVEDFDQKIVVLERLLHPDEGLLIAGYDKVWNPKQSALIV